MAQRRIYQFLVTLLYSDPQIWRRIQVPGDYSFWDLHVAIQDAMGWDDYHLHAFRSADRRSGPREMIGIPDEEGLELTPTRPGWEVPISEHFKDPGTRLLYEYDFVDGWEHDVQLEEILPVEKGVRYPRCTAGERACPPEDSGGVPGYECLIEAMANADSEDYQNMIKWLGKPFNPEKFSADKVHFDDPRARWDLAFG